MSNEAKICDRCGRPYAIADFKPLYLLYDVIQGPSIDFCLSCHSDLITFLQAKGKFKDDDYGR